MPNTQSYIAHHYKELDDLKNDFRNSNLIQLVSSRIKGDHILDIGCGCGHLINLIEKKGKKVTGIEPNKELVMMTKNRNPNLNVIECSAEDANKINGEYSSITMIDVLEHIENDEKTIQDCYKKLNKEGRLIVIVPAYQFLFGVRDKNMGHYRRYSKKELMEKVLKNNFKINEMRYWNMLGFLPYLIFQKILKKSGMVYLRTTKKKNLLDKIIIRVLNLWFKLIENNINFRFGLSLICIAEK